MSLSISPTTFLPHITGIRLDHIDVMDQRITLALTTTRLRAACPLCGRLSRSVHSAYMRTVADQPWCGRIVSLRVRVRRFVCGVATCRRKIFCERLPALVGVYARRTNGLTHALVRISAAMASTVGARLATAQGMPTSWMTLLRLLKRLPVDHIATPRVLGIDDWSWRKGRTYGTMLVDLERHRPVDLLPDRTASTVAGWLRDHTGVEIISRDRGGAYADGARQGAPHALQVADRFHLLKNASESLDHLLIRTHAVLRSAARALVPEPVRQTIASVPTLTRVRRDQAERHDRRDARYAEIMTLHAQHYGHRAIARTLGIARHTVQRVVRADGAPALAARARRVTLLTPYAPYLRERWDAGDQNAAVLYQAIRARGFTGAPSLVRQHVSGWRDGPARSGRISAPPPRRLFSARQTLWLFLADPATLDPEERTYLGHIRTLCPEIAQADILLSAFRHLVRERDHAALDSWVDEAAANVSPEMRGFAAGLRRDHAAVAAALTTSWSNGQTEGQINRLKTLKRQGYGRASFTLLRQRVLQRA